MCKALQVKNNFALYKVLCKPDYKIAPNVRHFSLSLWDF